MRRTPHDAAAKEAGSAGAEAQKPDRLLAVQGAQSQVVSDAVLESWDGEEKPGCANCQRQGERCDYSIRLNWDGRVTKTTAAKKKKIPQTNRHGQAASPPARQLSHTPNGTPFSITDSSDSPDEPAHDLLDYDPLDAARVPVQSLLSPPPLPPAPCPLPGAAVVRFGFDGGRADLDLGRNDDAGALACAAPLELPAGPLARREFTRGGYYAQPVAIEIPRALVPLPAGLQSNAMNLLYFHHFLNHTSRILVPHACARNPFAAVLPAMAVQDPSLLTLLLAYAASHRARLLGHPKPYVRIAHWTRHVFPQLRTALDDPRARVSDTHLATAIMLVSQKIISPSTFEVPTPWESHLALARGLFRARRAVPRRPPAPAVDFFLCRWLGYLDLLGSLSSRRTDAPLFGGTYWAAGDGPDDPAHALDVDCFSGFTPETRALLTRLAELVHHVESAPPPHPAPPGAQTTPSPPFRPAPPPTAAAAALLADLTAALARRPDGRTHHAAAADLLALDDAYRLAALVQLHRRVLGDPAGAAPVRAAVAALLAALDRVPRGEGSDVCALLPLFTAGCETTDPAARVRIRARLKAVEQVGMKQIRRARKLMQRSWKEQLPWTALADGEFLG
ncbi:hypothetical protein LOZ55_004786 [Ophidiomyces ophidiicola]|nr:hypothetical protein LOZ55_004786 [Ophidiomyces ophidiicola]